LKRIKKIAACILGCTVFLTAFAQERLTLVGNLSITGLPIHDVWGYTDSSNGFNYALLGASTSGLRVVDITDSSNPKLVGSISGNQVYAIDVKTWKNFAYVVGENTSIRGKIIDLSDPSKPVLSGSFPGAHNITITDKGFMYLSVPGLRIFDLNSDPTNPKLLYTDNSCEGHDISIVGSTLYDFSNNCGTRIYELSKPDSLTTLGLVPLSGIYHHSGWPSEDGNYLFICDELASPNENDITVWDIRNPSNASLVDSFSDPKAYVHNIYILGNYAYVSYYRAGFRVFNVSDPTDIFLVSEYDTDSTLDGPGYGGNFGIYPFWGTDEILASDEENGLYIFKFTGLTAATGDKKSNKTNVLLIRPNPSSERSTLQYTLARKSNVEVGIYNINGQLIYSTNEGIKKVGIHTVPISTKEMQQGLYLIKVRLDSGILIERMMVVH
jgi:choice-of-anchor B domain-containing protein